MGFQHASEQANEGRGSGGHLSLSTQQAGSHTQPSTVTRTSSGAVRASGSRLSGAMGSMGAGATCRGRGWEQRHGLSSSNRLKQTAANIKPGPVQRQVSGSRFSRLHVDQLPFLPTTSHATATQQQQPSKPHLHVHRQVHGIDLLRQLLLPRAQVVLHEKEKEFEFGV